MMTSKQFPLPGDVVLTSLRGLCETNPAVSLIENEKVIFRTDSEAGKTSKVTLLSGGGSGHEPIHAGFVGQGLLDAAVCGHIFASPSSKQVYAGLKAIASPSGILVIVKNYTGDVIHFGLAVERIKAEGVKAEMVVVGDDVAVGRQQGGLVGRRGLAATCLVHKVAGAAAKRGLDLKDVALVARSVAENSVTIGSSLDHCAIPGLQFHSTLGEDEIEVGMGIHNESGFSRLKPIPSVPELVKALSELLLSEDDKDRSFVRFRQEDDVVLLVNNLGGLSNLELSYITSTVADHLQQKYNIKCVRVYSGSLITALNGPGFSITLLNASSASKDSKVSIVELLDAPAHAPGWPSFVSNPLQWENDISSRIRTTEGHTKYVSTGKTVSVDKPLFVSMLKSGLTALLDVEPLVTKYDTIAGDGDCGETLASGANAILKAISDGSIRFDDAVSAVMDIAEIVEDSMGGTSGGLYSIYLSALGTALKHADSSSMSESLFSQAASEALHSLYKYTRARIGDRTLIDALAPFVDACKDGQSFEQAVAAAQAGAESTKLLEAKFGRASYVSRKELVEIPDPGAFGLSALLTGFLKGCKS
jgi:dihydroxyacetone kinase